jgi:hypothetical protein
MPGRIGTVPDLHDVAQFGSGVIAMIFWSNTE